jgi:RNA polymerase sigma-70 factor (ECF subfamily)
VARLKRRDDARDWLNAWETLIQEHGRRVYGLALRTLRHRQDAEDATQAVWERVLSGLATFRGDSSLRTWLFRITMNVCLTRIEARNRAPTAYRDDDDPDLFDDVADGAPDPERLALGSAVRAAVERAIGELDPAFRSAIVLRELEGLSYDEIAVVLDVPINTVKTRIYRARLELQAKLRALRS